MFPQPPVGMWRWSMFLQSAPEARLGFPVFPRHGRCSVTGCGRSGYAAVLRSQTRDALHWQTYCETHAVARGVPWRETDADADGAQVGPEEPAIASPPPAPRQHTSDESVVEDTPDRDVSAITVAHVQCPQCRGWVQADVGAIVAGGAEPTAWVTCEDCETDVVLRAGMTWVHGGVA